MAESQTFYVSHAPAMEILQHRGTVYYNLQLETKGIDNKPSASASTKFSGNKMNRFPRDRSFSDLKCSPRKKLTE